MDPELRSAIARLRRDWHIVGPRLMRICLAFVVAWLPMLLVKHGAIERFENHLLRAWFSARGARGMPETVSIVRLDKPAYDLLNLSTGTMYPRAKLAGIIEAVSEAGAKLIMLDLIFEREWQETQDDQKLAKALRSSPSIIGRSAREFSEPTLSGDRSVQRTLIQPAPLFAQAAKHVISLNIPVDADGKSRGVNLSNERGFRSDTNVPLLPALREFVSPSLVEPGAFDFINFYGGPSTILSLSAKRLLSADDAVDPAYFKDRMVFVGVYADAAVGIDGKSDVFMTSYSDESMAGVEIHATIAANLLDGTWLRRSPATLTGIAMSIWTFVVSFLVLGSGAIGALTVVVVSGGIWLGASYYAFTEHFYFVPGLALCCFVLPIAALVRWGYLVYKYRAQAKAARG